MKLFLIVCALLYFLPTFIARKDKHLPKIFYLNFLLGWTVIFWFVVLTWALFFKHPKRPKKEELERLLLNLIRAKGGKITPVEIAADTDLSLDQAQKELDQLRDRGVAEMQVTESGKLVYVFQGFVSEHEKMTTKSPLDL